MHNVLDEFCKSLAGGVSGHDAFFRFALGLPVMLAAQVGIGAAQKKKAMSTNNKCCRDGVACVAKLGSFCAVEEVGGKLQCVVGSNACG
jgi:hypothetical protein